MSVITASEQPFNQVARQMSKLMEQMGKGYYGFAPSETWTPNVNLYETDDAYLVCVDLAGVDKEKIDVVVADGRLKLRGTRIVPMHPDGNLGSGAGGGAGANTGAGGHGEGGRNPRAGRLRVHLMEIDHGAFTREVELPHDVAKQHITAVYRDGMLWIELPKK